LKNLDVVLKIVRVMQKANKPLILNHIAKRAKTAPQLVDYHLEKLIENGIICSIDDDGSTYYALQPAFYDENWLNALYVQITPFVEAMAGGGSILFEQAKVAEEKVVINVLSIFLERFKEEIQKTFKKSLTKNV